jgi:UDP-N-acetylmuramate--alanine ligase
LIGHPSFTIFFGNEEIAQVTLSVPGKHNVSNALAAVACCYKLGCDRKAIEKGLLAFTGTKKRFERKGNVKGIEIIDDYAHHPSEVKATLAAAANYDKNKLWCVFQPHTYTRTKAFMEEFSEAFTQADKVIVTDIYAAREKNPGDIHSKTLADKMLEKGVAVTYIKEFDDIANYIMENAEAGDMVITMGAGDVVKVCDFMLEKG